MHRVLWIRSCRDLAVMLTVSGLSMLADKPALLNCVVGPPVWKTYQSGRTFKEASLSKHCFVWKVDQEQTCLEADLPTKMTCLGS